MLKSRLLSSVRPFLDAEKGSGSGGDDPEKVRNSIKVESIKKDDPKQDDPKDDDNKDVEDVKDEETENEDEVVEEKELTAEELKAEKAKLEKKVARLEKRVGRTAGERDTIRQQLADAQAALAAKSEAGEGLTEEEVERRANLKADEKAAEREFTNAVNTLTKDASKVDKEFKQKIIEITTEFGPVPGAMIGILEDMDNGNGGAVFAHLANNPEDYEEIYNLPLAKLSNRLNKLSDKLKEEAQPKKKAISKVSDPIKPIKGSEKSPSVLPANPTKDMDTFVRMRNNQEAERRKAKYG